MDVLNLAFLEMHVVLLRRTVGIVAPLVDPHFIQAGRQRGQALQALQDRAVFEAGHVGRDKDAEVADLGVQQVDDALSRRFQVIGARVDGGNPVERLVRGVMLSPLDAKTTIGLRMRLRST